jgi:CelD/BcsL family acetyltransferase involved in cellulose biosynthesis
MQSTAIDQEQLTVARLMPDEFRTISESWNRLVGDVPFRRHEWLAAWWRHLSRKDDELFVVAVRDPDGTLVGLAPWFLHRGRYSGRALRFLGSGRVCSEYLTVLAAPGLETAITHRLARWLSGESAGDWDVIDLDGVDASDGTLGELARQMKSLGHDVFRRPRSYTWRLELPADWDAFIGRLSSKRRNRVRTQQRRMLDSGQARVCGAQTEAEVRRGLAIFELLHRRRRQTLGDEGCFSIGGFAAFIHEAARSFFAAGRLQLDWLEIDERPVAVELKLLGDETVYYYQTGMDPALTEISPGWLLQIASLRRAIGGGFRTFDFLRGDENYKSSWRAEPQPLIQVRIAARGPTARLRHRLWLAGLRGKTLLNGPSHV